MSRSTRSKAPWIAALLSLFLVFVLPACWSGVLTRAWLELGQGPSSNNTNEEREERELHEEAEVARLSSPPPPKQPQIVGDAARILAVHRGPTRLASVAPKLHPSRYSERRLR